MKIDNAKRLITTPFWVNIFFQKKQPVLQLRKTTFDKKEITWILHSLVKYDEINIQGKVKFKNKLSAKIRLNKLGLLE